MHLVNTNTNDLGTMKRNDAEHRYLGARRIQCLLLALSCFGLYACDDDSSASTKVAENTVDLCRDTIDNDANGKMDCDDDSCKGFDHCKTGPATTEICDNQIDDDGDDKLDCGDEDCATADACRVVITECTEKDNSCLDRTRNYCDGGTLKMETCPFECAPEGCVTCKSVHGEEKCDESGVHTYCTDTEFVTETCGYGCEGNHCRTCVVGTKQCSQDGSAVVECKEVEGKAQWVSSACQKGCGYGMCLECTEEDRTGFICEGDVRRYCHASGIWNFAECRYGCFNEEECKKYPAVGLICANDGSAVLEYTEDNQILIRRYCDNNTCRSGTCDDKNGNHKRDEYDGDWENAPKCTKHSECDTSFCDLMVNDGTCMPKCTDSSQCFDGYICRPDGRCSPEAFSIDVAVERASPKVSFFIYEDPDSADKTPAVCDFTINWGDGKTESYTKCEETSTTWWTLSHGYSKEGTYTITITGKLTRLGLQWSDWAHWIGVNSFGPIGLTDNAFSALKNNAHFSLPDDDIPDATLLKTTKGFFLGASNLDFNNFESISKWDTSNVIDMSSMFTACANFNLDISKWDTSNVENMSQMFQGAKKFNQNISGWNTGKVKDMSSMFDRAMDFNQPIGSWDTSNVEDMSYMFAEKNYRASDSCTINPPCIVTAFNQNISNWNVSKVKNMSGMFKNSSFNSSISNWDVSNVTDMSEMFMHNQKFNMPLKKWKVGNVTNMQMMFYDAPAFNQDLSDWNVSKVTNMAWMFAFASAFEGAGYTHQTDLQKRILGIGVWNVSNVTDMRQMFKDAKVFNCALGRWKVDNVQNMNSMFLGALAYSKVPDNWRPRYIINSRDCERLGAMFYATQLTCSQVTDLLSLWELTGICTASNLGVSCQ